MDGAHIPSEISFFFLFVHVHAIPSHDMLVRPQPPPPPLVFLCILFVEKKKKPRMEMVAQIGSLFSGENFPF